MNTYSNFTISEGYKVKFENEDEEFDLKFLLEKTILFGSDGVLEAYSNLSYPFKVQIKTGILTRIDLIEFRKKFHLSNDLQPFAIKLSTAIMGDVLAGEHCFPNIFMAENDFILIGSSSHFGNPPNKIFTEYVQVYFYKSLGLAWQDVLYKSLQEYSKLNYNIALVLLFSALDIYTRMFFKEGAAPNTISHRLRVLGVKNKKSFEKKLARVRADFEHDHRPVLQEEIKKGYQIAFQIFWELQEKGN